MPRWRERRDGGTFFQHICVMAADARRPKCPRPTEWPWNECLEPDVKSLRDAHWGSWGATGWQHRVSSSHRAGPDGHDFSIAKRVAAKYMYGDFCLSCHHQPSNTYKTPQSPDWPVFFFFIKKKNFTFLKLLLFSIIAGVSLFPEAEPPEATALWPWSRE